VLLRLFIFLFGQIILLVGGWWTISDLIRRKQLITVWGLVISAWYCYLLIWYGPTSVFAALGSRYVHLADAYPWRISGEMLIISLLSAVLLQAIPFVLNIIIHKTPLPIFKVLFLRLEPLLGHVSCLWFGLLGTIAQLYAAFLFGNLWLQGRFDFGSLSLLQKSVLSGFLIFTIGPQVSLLFYKHFRHKPSISDLALNALICFSLFSGLYAFTAFGQRTYVILEIFLLAYLLFSGARRYKKLVFYMLPIALFLGFTVTSLQNRIELSQNPFETVSLAGKHLIKDLSYRSHIANDSVLINARSCVLDQLNDSGLSAGSLFPIELASGLPRQIRQALPLDVESVRLEKLVGNCFKLWLNPKPWINIDLSDSKGQYFLIMFGQFVAPFVSTIFWFLLHTFYILLFYTVFSFGLRYVAFAIPASVHFLVFGTTPGEFFVVVKAMTPYLLILYIIDFYLRCSKGNTIKKPE